MDLARHGRREATVLTEDQRVPTTAHEPLATLDASLWKSPVLIGTVETLAALAGQLAVTNLLPNHIGCVLVRREQGIEVSDDIAGLPVLGTLDLLPALHAERPFSAAIVSLPGSERALASKVSTVLRAMSVPERFVPTLGDLLAKPPSASPLAPASMNMAELIGRSPYGIDRRLVRSAIEAKRVLITGAGGSIGGEIARICASFRPSLLVLMERSENALFEIDRQLARKFPDVPRRAVLCDVADADATLRQVVAIKPHAVFHAAAHKHVPLMEDHPAHAVTNNIFGTKAIADAATQVGAERFVMISTDKAVNPSSAMGATKRLAEMYVQSLAHDRARRVQTAYAIVRFGNVLGSACSVLPIWTNQLAEGGPLSVTDARMTRYFMTIHEAASLVIQAGSIPSEKSATVYVLDMGEPIRILDLAQRFLRLYGFEPRLVGPQGVAVEPATDAGPIMDIVLSGARPGEKLHEELAYAAEELTPTPYPGVQAYRAADALSDLPDIPAMLAELTAVRHAASPDLVRATLRRFIPAYTEPMASCNTNQNTNLAA
jgi:FlaA1/EpsC-like NDP-sugar epimerase